MLLAHGIWPGDLDGLTPPEWRALLATIQQADAEKAQSSAGPKPRTVEEFMDRARS